MTTKISGKVTKIIFTKEDFHICLVNTATGDHTVKLNHNNLKVGFLGDFTGIWVDDERYGGQFKCYFAIEKLPETKEGFKQYLMSKTFKGIGEKTADKIIKHLGENPVEALSKDPNIVLKTPGVKKELLEQIKTVYLDNTVRADITIFLQQHGISPNLINKIYDEFGLDTIPQLTKNAYQLINRIDGIGFKIADRIAIKMGIDPKSELRITECVKYVLKEAGNIGYCYLLRPQIHKKVQELIEKIEIELVDRCIVESQDIIKLEMNDEERFYSRVYYNAEQRCLNNLIYMLEQPPVGFMDNVAQEETLSPEQKNAVYGALSNNVSILTGGPGCGKCLKKGTLVLMFNGDKKAVEDIQVGDLLMGDDNTPRTVLSLAHGYETMYDIISKDNKEWGCNESHILSLKYNGKRNCIINGIKYKTGDIVDIEVRDYLNLNKKKKHYLKQYSVPVEYDPKTVLIPPYLLGLWLGDGSKSSSIITNVDDEIYEYCELVAPNLGLTFNRKDNGNKAPHLSFIGERNNSYRTLLNQYGLYKNKHIPKDYLINSREIRLNLLGGLIDSDGYYRNGTFEITQKNKRLAYNIYDLALSLGFRVSICEKMAKLKREGKSDYNCLVYRLCISGNCDQIPTLIKRKRGICKPNKNHLHSGFELINKGVGEYYGFELDGNKRFVLGNFVVTHNTYTTKTIVESLLNANKEVGICAPTGKAALRSSTVIGHEAMTIHRILGFNPTYQGSFEYTSENPLPYDFIIVEESSMIDIKLMASLLDAVGYGTQILFVGDHNQLPPVGAGAPFKDMIDSGLIPTFKLNKIFRQGDDSRLVNFAHQINNSEYPQIDSPIKNPGLWATKTDCLFIDSGFSDGRKRTEYDKTNTLHFGIDVAETIVRLYTETVKKYRNYNDIQILVPKRVGTIGTNVINAMIQDVVNPITAGSKLIAIGERTFRLNDKVIHVQNNYNLGNDGIFNGEIGRIIDITDKGCVINFDGKEVAYKRSDMFDLELAFAISIHKSQGSEFECVILPLMMEYGIMLEKSLIYTGLTRAKKLAIFVGQRQALMRSIHNTNQSKRQTSLSELLVENKNLVE
jgi:ATP-dependent exoDNAse (exonuclease V) alpha subunit